MLISLLIVPTLVVAQLESRILRTIDSMVSVVNVLLIGAVVWAGLLMAKGDGTGMQRLIYSIIGLVVVNSARLIVYYFTP